MLSPLTWLLLGVLAILVAARLGRGGRWLRRAGEATVLIATVATTPWAANTLVGALETAEAPPAACAASPPAVAVVLAGGVDATPRGADDFGAMAISSRRRTERAVAWWHERPGRTLVMSGGARRGDRIPAAVLMADYARRLGVAPAALRVERDSTSTWTNARAVAAMRPALPRRVVLVTSASHMPRARYALDRAGFATCPLATDPRYLPFALPGYLIPGSSALVKTETALHELVGLAYYRWLDWRSRP